MLDVAKEAVPLMVEKMIAGIVNQAFNELEQQKMKKQIESMQITQKEEEHAKKFYQEQCSLINEYIDSFYKLYERKPLEDEIHIILMFFSFKFSLYKIDNDKSLYIYFNKKQN